MSQALPPAVHEAMLKELPVDTHKLLPSSLRGRVDVSEANWVFLCVAFCEARAHSLELDPRVSEPFCMEVYPLPSWGITPQRLGVGPSLGEDNGNI